MFGCGGDDEEGDGTPKPEATELGQPMRGGTIRSSSTVSLLSLDPHTAEGNIIGNSAYSRLVLATDWAGILPDAAESWEVVDDLTWIFHVRGDIKYQNIPPVSGRLLVAGDVVYSFERLRSLPGASQIWDEWTDTYEAPDDTTFKFVSKKPYGYMLMNIGFAIVPREAVEEFGDLKSNAIGSGPFQLKEYSRDVGMEWVHNPDFYHEYPYVDGVSVRVMPDDASVQAAFRAGQLDTYNAWTKVFADNVANVPGVSVQRYLNTMWSVFIMNGTKVEAFKDERVREAVDKALDRKQMIQRLHFGEAELAGPVPPIWDTALPAGEVEAAYERDVTKARQLLSAAGQEDLRFSLLFARVADAADVAAILKSNLADAGITADLDGRELGAWLQAVLAGDAETTTMAHSKYVTDEVALQSQHSRGASRADYEDLGVEDPETDALLEKIPETIDPEERKALAWEVQRRVLKRHGPHLVLFEPYGFWCAYNYIKNYKATANGFGRYKYDIWIDKG